VPSAGVPSSDADANFVVICALRISFNAASSCGAIQHNANAVHVTLSLLWIHPRSWLVPRCSRYGRRPRTAAEAGKPHFNMRKGGSRYGLVGNADCFRTEYAYLIDDFSVFSFFFASSELGLSYIDCPSHSAFLPISTGTAPPQRTSRLIVPPAGSVMGALAAHVVTTTPLYYAVPRA